MSRSHPLTALAAVAVLGLAACSSTADSAPTSTSAASTTTTTTRPAPTTTEATATTEAPTTTSTTSTTLPPTTFRAVSTEAPLRVWLGGDSLGAYIVTGLLGGIADLTLASITHDFRISSSLTQPDFVDWPATMVQVMSTEAPPEVVVFMVGGNDNQPMLDAAGTPLSTMSPEWQVEYRARVAALMDATAREGTRLIWIGLPPPKSGIRLELNPKLNAIFAEEAALRPWVTYVDIGPLLSNPDGSYADRLPPPGGGDPITVRSNDGVHVTRRASEWIADIVWAQIVSTWALPPGQ